MSRTAGTHPGFTAVELLVTLFIAAVFLFSGYQLFNVVTMNGAEARNQSRVSTTAATYLQQYKASANTTCAASTPVNGQSITIEGVFSPVVTVQVTCPLAATPSLSKITVTINYGTGSDARSVTRATLVSKT